MNTANHRAALLARSFRDAGLRIGSTPLRPLTAGTLAILIETGNPLFAEAAPSLGELAAGIYAAYAASYQCPLPSWADLTESDEPGDLQESVAWHAAARRALEIICPNLPVDSGVPIGAAAGMDAIFEFIWIHSAPLDEVLAVTSPDHGDFRTLRRHARRMALTLDFDDLAEFQNQFADLLARVNAALVETADEEEGDTAPGKSPTNLTGSPPTSAPSEPAATPPPSIGPSGLSLSTAASNTSTPPTLPPEPLCASPLISLEGMPMPFPTLPAD